MAKITGSSDTPVYYHQNGDSHQVIITDNRYGPDGVSIMRLGNEVTINARFDSGFLLVRTHIPLADFLTGLGVMQEIQNLNDEIDRLKREVNEYEGKDWRSDGPVYPEVV